MKAPRCQTSALFTRIETNGVKLKIEFWGTSGQVTNELERVIGGSRNDSADCDLLWRVKIRRNSPLYAARGINEDNLRARFNPREGIGGGKRHEFIVDLEDRTWT